MGKNIFIGISGWTYKHWNKTFFPDEIPKKIGLNLIVMLNEMVHK